MRLKLAFSLLLWLFFYVYIHAQQPAVREFNSKYGIPSETVYDLNFDKQNNLLLGTRTGLVVLKGRKFEVFNNNLSNSAVTSLIQVFNNNIILGYNFSNEFTFYLKDTSYSFFVSPSLLGGYVIFNYQISSNGSGLFYITNKVLCSHDFVTGKDHCLYTIPPGNKEIILDLYVDKGDTIYIATQDRKSVV